ncbi:uncharacterized protein LOC111083452 [Limulus polyphemus]|uniref:Uncharacterized protein LOC111083452 n=1 Tax=Limulus polyphemus TaxID=6850 RepID=A0ABM1RWD4_LIMPO|nr:uncharacterized protein LOC111083452 [Limulus polyphemus]
MLLMVTMFCLSKTEIITEIIQEDEVPVKNISRRQAVYRKENKPTYSDNGIYDTSTSKYGDSTNEWNSMNGYGNSFGGKFSTKGVGLGNSAFGNGGKGGFGYNGNGFGGFSGTNSVRFQGGIGPNSFNGRFGPSGFSGGFGPVDFRGGFGNGGFRGGFGHGGFRGGFGNSGFRGGFGQGGFGMVPSFHSGLRNSIGSGFGKGSLVILLALIAPLAILAILGPIIASQLVVPTTLLTTTVNGRRRRDAGLRLPFSEEVATSEMKHRVEMLQALQFYLNETGETRSYQEDLTANYLACSGLLSVTNHCLERLACEFSVSTQKVASLENEIASVVLHTILTNKKILESDKSRIRKAAIHGKKKGGSCRVFFCKNVDEKLNNS